MTSRGPFFSWRRRSLRDRAALGMDLDLLAAAKEQRAIAQCATVGDVLLQVEEGFSRFLRTPRL